VCMCVCVLFSVAPCCQTVSLAQLLLFCQTGIEYLMCVSLHIVRKFVSGEDGAAVSSRRRGSSAEIVRSFSFCVYF